MEKYVKDSVDVNEIVKNFENKCYTPLFDNVMSGVIYDKETLFDILDFFVRNDDNRAFEMLEIINKPIYNFDISELIKKEFDHYVEIEWYEECNMYKKYNLI
jgi:hypothetical protein